MKKLLIVLIVLIVAFAALCFVSFQKYAHPKGFKTPIENPVANSAL